MRDYADIISQIRIAAIGVKKPSNRLTLMQDAADAIEELLAVVPKWISVEERLPEKHVEVLICTEDYGKNELGFATVAVWDGSEWIETWDRKKSVYHVSHWVPLPEPPKEELNKNVG